MLVINPRTGKGWSDAEEAVIAKIVADRRCSRIQAIHLYKRGNPDGPLTNFSRSRTEPTERMAAFAKENRLRLADTGAEKLVQGKYGQLADMNDDGLLRLRLLATPRGANMDRTLRSRRSSALAGGLKLKWRGDAESILYFDLANEQQVSLAIKLSGAKRKRVRVITEAQKQVLAARMAQMRQHRLPQAA